MNVLLLGLLAGAGAAILLKRDEVLPPLPMIEPSPVLPMPISVVPTPVVVDNTPIIVRPPIIVNPPSVGVWPNEPAGFRVISDWGFDSTVLASGWGTNNNMQIVTDPTAPLSPSRVLEMRYPIGFTGGKGPGNVYYPLPHPREAYIGYYWKPSNPWQGHSSEINKISFMFGADMSWAWVMDMFGATEPYRYILTNSSSIVDNTHIAGTYGSGVGSRNFSSNMRSGVVVLGAWHQIELYIKMSSTTTSRDGIIRWWVDRQLLGEYTNVNTDQSPLGEFQFAPTWGGIGDMKNENDYYRYDHVHVSIP